MPRRFRHAAILLLLLCTGALTLPATALAHANLVHSEPADGATVDALPSTVVLTFSDDVRLESSEAVKVFAPDGSVVSNGQASVDGEMVVERLGKNDAHGTYAVAWRVTSEDGHTLTDTLTFNVGGRSGSKAVALSRHEAEVPRALKVGAGVARGLEIAGLLALVGGGIFAALVAPGWGMRFVWPIAAVFVAGLALAYWIDAAVSHHVAFGAAVQPKHLAREASTPYGSALLVSAAATLLALPVVALLRHRRVTTTGARAASALVLCGLAATLSLAGHASTADPVLARMPLDMLHVVAAAVWLGGLLQLLALAPYLDDHPGVLRRFSSIAFACVVALLVTGAYATLVELDMRPATLLDTQYGRIVLAKLVLYAGTLPLAWLNKSTYVPAIERRPDSAAHLLRQYMARELVLVLAVVALTAWLIGTDQPA